LARQAGIAESNVFVIENGRVVEIDKYGIKLGERVPGGYVFVDGSGVGDIGRIVIRDREILARHGFLLVAVNVDGRTGELIGQPEIISRGFVYLRDSDELLDQVRGTIEDVMANNVNSNGKRREKLQESISRMLYNETKRRPMVFSIVNEHNK
jgi:ribonuclease J